MEQTKALNALEPFIVLSKSATSPRAAADLVTRATSAPNTFLFSDLLQTPAIQNLADSEFASHLKLLQIFSYGTYSSYKTTEGLPALAEVQATKLRQLSLLSLVRDRQNLSYAALQEALDLPGAREVETLVISAVYAGLLHATLDPARAVVQVSSVAPLRDLAPGAIPEMATALKKWSDRCTTTLDGLDLQIKEIRTIAAARQREQRLADEKLQQLMNEQQEGIGPRKYDLPNMTRDLGRRGFNKRSVMDTGNLVDNDSMDVDEAEEEKKRANKRKL
ncbi:COP9 signalosome complex subunit 7a [Fusarium oxysporum f. sp. cubense]|uniref:COP9 signalosome complex subunit 7a n=1 Tax=Fusarium oxysporum f. sp. cubense TaxID=61366 RepID=A0A559LCJ9_FUSOC|nr:COP9 signalosome complex subunit 7a [Fusarium oxysporum f. sp. cubense]